MNVDKKIALICDDSLLVRKKLKELLLECGCQEVIEATNGQEAIKLYQSRKPSVVFMDIVMPMINGIEALTKIKELDKNANVIMVSSVGTKTNLMDALKLGAKDFIQKPYDKEQILKIINTI